MISVAKLRFFVIAGLLLVVSALYAAVLVCRECGYESPEGSEFCSHCKVKLPVSKPQNQPVDGQSDNMLPSGKIRYIDPSLVENEITIAQKCLDNGDLEIANLFARNAAALEMLTNPRAKGGRAELIVEIRKKSEAGGMTVDRKCPACKGTGKHIMEIPALDGKITNIEVAGMACPKCKGTGKIMKPSTMDERKYRIGRAMNKFTSLQQSRKFVPFGAAWLPSEIDGKLSAKQAALIKRSVAAPCPDCMGLGRIDCTRCKGQGEIKCAFSGCVNGKIEIKEEGTLIKGKAKKLITCRNCSGSGFVACLDCRSKGSYVCKKCSGSGERALCTRCDGQGYVSCKRCQSSGIVKELACSECRGDGFLECTECNGDGRKR